MTKPTNWERARDWILESISAQALGAGDRLPPEQDIQRASGVGRHSVRRAVAALAAEGLLSVEQGRGTFVRTRPAILYRISTRTRFRENLLSQGVAPGGDAIDAAIVPAGKAAARALDLPAGTPVHRLLRRGRADGRPINLTCSFHPADRFPDLAHRRQQGVSVSDIYRDHGIADYRRRQTTLFARLPESWEARILEQPAAQPVMVMCKTDIDLDGRPIGHAEAIWAAGQVRFMLDLAGEEAEDA